MTDDTHAPGIQPLKDAVGLIGPESPWPLQVERRPGSPLFFAHRGSSMHPTLRESDLLEIVPYSGKASSDESDSPFPSVGEVGWGGICAATAGALAWVGDVIALAPLNADHLVVHRVVRVTSERVCTRGDNNAGEDGWCLGPERVIGWVVAARRGRRRRRIFGGWAGRLWAWVVRGRCILGHVASVLLRPAYHGLACTGIVRGLAPDFLRPRVVAFRAGEQQRLRLLLGRRIVGEYMPGWRSWRFRRPFRLLVDEAALPQALPTTSKLGEGGDD